MKNNNKIQKLSGIVAIVAIIICIIYTIISSTNITDNIGEIISLFLILGFACFYVLYIFDSKKQIYSTLGSTTLILFGLFTIVNGLDLSFAATTPNFTNKVYTEVLSWAEENKIEIVQTYEYSDIVPSYHIIYQDSTTINEKTTMTIAISEGPNPDKRVTIPIMNGWSDDQVLEFVRENHLSNVEINFIVSGKQQDTVIEQSYTGEMKRSDILTLTFSIGEEIPAEFAMPNLENMSKFEATFLLKQKGVTTINYDTAYDDKIMKNNVVTQNIKTGEPVSTTNTEIILTISKGIEIKVADITNMNLDELMNWTTTNRLKLEISDNYHESIKEGNVIEANYQKDDTVEEGTIIKVVISKGPLTMEEFATVNDFKEWTSTYNIAYTESYEFNNDIAQGNAISYSHEVGQTIKTGESIHVTISNGGAVTIPNLINKTKTEIDKLCSDNELSCSYLYSYSSTVTKGYSISQSKTAGSEVTKGTSVSITLSNGVKPASSNSSSSSGSNNNTTTTPSTPETPTTPTCDKTITTTVWLQPGNTGAQTKANVLKYSNINWVFNMVDVCPNGDATSGVVCNATSLDEQALNHCDSYSITIVN